MLITIACVAVAVVALLLAFLMSRGDGSKKAAPAKAVAPASQPEKLAAEPPTQELPVQPIEEQQTQQAPQLSRPQPAQPTQQVPQLNFDESPKYTIPVPEYHESTTEVHNHFQSNSTALTNSASVPASHEEDSSDEDITTLSRKLYELAGQMHFLQRRSREVEQSLAQLSGVIENLQQQKVRQNRLSAQNAQSEVEYAGSSHSHPYGEGNF